MGDSLLIQDGASSSKLWITLNKVLHVPVPVPSRSPPLGPGLTCIMCCCASTHPMYLRRSDGWCAAGPGEAGDRVLGRGGDPVPRSERAGNECS